MNRSLVAALVLTAASSFAAASSHRPMSFDQVVRQADVGFHGVVRSKREIAPEGVAMAFTVITFEVREWVFDRTGRGGDTIELTFAGGRRGDRYVTVAGVATFEVGEEVVLFSRHDGQRYADPIVGGPAGRFRVRQDVVTKRAFPLADGGAGVVLGTNGVLTYTDAIERIEAGAPVWREAAAAAAVPLPTPVGDAGEVRRATLASAPRPAQVSDLAAFLAFSRDRASR